MDNKIKINIDLNSGKVEIDSPEDSLDKVFDRLEKFLPKISESYSKFNSKENDELPETSGDLNGSDDNDGGEVTDPPAEKPKSKPRRSSNSSKPETYKVVDFKLDEKQRQDFRDFYLSKKPSSQNEHVLTIMYWLLQNLEKDVLTKEEIFTGLRTVDEKTPKRLTSVISNLSLDGYILSEKEGYRLHHTGEDFIKFSLPKQAKK